MELSGPLVSRHSVAHPSLVGTQTAFARTADFQILVFFFLKGSHLLERRLFLGPAGTCIWLSLPTKGHPESHPSGSRRPGLLLLSPISLRLLLGCLPPEPACLRGHEQGKPPLCPNSHERKMGGDISLASSTHLLNLSHPSFLSTGLGNLQVLKTGTGTRRLPEDSGALLLEVVSLGAAYCLSWLCSARAPRCFWPEGLV